MCLGCSNPGGAGIIGASRWTAETDGRRRTGVRPRRGGRRDCRLRIGRAIVGGFASHRVPDRGGRLRQEPVCRRPGRHRDGAAVSLDELALSDCVSVTPERPQDLRASGPRPRWLRSHQWHGLFQGKPAGLRRVGRRWRHGLELPRGPAVLPQERTQREFRSGRVPRPWRTDERSHGHPPKSSQLLLLRGPRQSGLRLPRGSERRG